MSMNRQQIYQTARNWAIQAGVMIKEYLNTNMIQHETKSHPSDLVTVMDRAVEEYLVKHIQCHFPEHYILGEEGISKKVTDYNDYVWIIDPIDGTNNFVSQQCDFVISLALYHEQQGVFGIIYDVIRDEMVHALTGNGVYINDQPVGQMNSNLLLMDSIISTEYVCRTEEQVREGQKLVELCPKIRGMRVYGATALSMAKVAAGKNNGFITLGTNPWDHAAGTVLVKEAGGIVTDFNGNPLPLDRRTSVIACNPAIFEDLMRFVQEMNLSDPMQEY